MKTFKQGIHPHDFKEKTEHLPIKKSQPPQKVVIPLSQHLGAPCEPLVKAGDEVKLGQKIGDSKSKISAPVHASVSGKVMSVDNAIVIQSDAQNTPDPSMKPHGELNSLSAEKIRSIVREAGIVGMGGAAFPTAFKISPPADKPIDTVIINGCECEPYITADHRMMLEMPDEIVAGAQAIQKAVGARNLIIGIEANKPDAIEVMRQKRVEVVRVKPKYPQGGEKLLIKAVLDREVPSGGLPLDVGVVVSNVATAIAVNTAIRSGLPLIERVLTVTGNGVKQPQNLLVRIGTTFADVISQCEGLTEDAAKVIMGGPMMGVTQDTLDVPVVKATSSILVLTRSEAKEEKVYPCVKCGRCVDHCPMFLVPTRLASYAEHDVNDEFDDWGGMDCIECGSCSYVCPANIPLVHWIKYGKMKMRQSAK
ncbi:MAG: electron transport complex subunit RsxC [Candidatus Margulisbacteria bacterium]|nr:electron transport complex subunit RsxC [Candidatus Margulisiibacteriota bacterium]